MLDFFNLPSPYAGAEVSYFFGTPQTGNMIQTWTKPRGKSMVHIVLVGPGGPGGNGVVGAASTAAGGGGGGGGGTTVLLMPLFFLPDTLHIMLPYNSATAAYISIAPDTATTPPARNILSYAQNGASGGNASGATAGVLGAGGSAATAANMPLGWAFAWVAVQGQSGIAGGTTGAAGALTLPTSGALVTGGTGGAGLGAAASTGSAGGNITGNGVFPTLNGGTAAGAATTPPGRGNFGYRPVSSMPFFYGGTGGGSTAGNATGAGLVQASGGNGAPGCGGGGSGGALTGSTAGSPGLGGPAFCIITCW